jgi:DNA replication protein DnaC
MKPISDGFKGLMAEAAARNLNAIVESRGKRYTSDGYEILELFSATCPDHGEYPRIKTTQGERGSCVACEEVGRQKQNAEAEARMKAEHIERLMSYEYSAMPARFAEKDFDNYNPATPVQKKALAVCRDYVSNIGKRVAAASCLVLIGPPGVGKTHLLAATARGAIYSEVHSRYTTMTAFLAAVRGAWAWHAEEHGADFKRPALLVLDDLWIPQSGRDRESLIAMLDERYLAKKVTLIGSNLPWPEMRKEVGERFCDRLLEGGGQVVPLDGKSMRATV